jgi:5'-3' exonuclease
VQLDDGCLHVLHACTVKALPVNVHLVDGTYELFRHYYGAPPAQDADGVEMGAVIGVLSSMLSLLDEATHVGVATDHVIESFRNELWRGYKTGEGIDPPLLAQFHPLEDALRAMGVTVFAMVEFEADDALASAAAVAAADSRVDHVLICTPDKDLAQSVVGQRVIQFDRRQRQARDEAGVIAKFGVPPASIPDYLALVGDSADGYPGLPGWGAKSAGAVLARFGHLERIPASARDWTGVSVRGADKLATMLAENMDLAQLFRTIATLRTDAPTITSVDELRWTGPRPEFEGWAERLKQPSFWKRATARAARR